MTETPRVARADRVAARATGVGVGLLAFMVVWLIGARVTVRIWGPPSSAVVALAIAVVAGILAAVVSDRRFADRLVTEVQRGAQP